MEGESECRYELQEAMQRELNERIPAAPKGNPKTSLRNIVHSHRLCGETFDQSVAEALSAIAKR